jgi:predicted nucleotidyltransferase
MENITFEKKVSKGSKFNQIYIPKEMAEIVEVGDLVQIKLLEKYTEIYYKNQKKLLEFKEYLVREMFSSLNRFKEIKNIFIVGSFLEEDIYNDIDVIITITERKTLNKYTEHLERKIRDFLVKKFNQKFHILIFNEEKLEKSIKIDPLIRVMFNNYVSNKEKKFDSKKIIDKKHIRFLLMMPEDLLEISVSSKIFYNNLKRLIAIEIFLKNMDLNIKIISSQIENELETNLLNKIKNNDEIDEKEILVLRKIIKKKIERIKKII